RCEKFTDLALHHSIIGTSTRVRLLLYTRHNDSCGTLLSHTNLIEHPQFNLSKPTTFIVHGFRPTGSPPAWLEDLTKWLLARADINVVIVDWNKGAANLNYLKAVKTISLTALCNFSKNSVSGSWCISKLDSHDWSQSGSPHFRFCGS
ncbi:hypothetical protein GOODEAATRI_008379, partial [Goodea atripinnis]